MSKMKSFILFILALLLVFHFPVEAGDRLWEPSHQSSLVHARWLHYREPSLWPNKKILMCYHNLETEILLAPYITDAMNLWYAVGLPDEYRIQRASDWKCPRERADVVMVYHEPGALASECGKETSAENGGPMMALHISGNAGLGNTAADIAHELGHAWGLLHEQQNPVFWAPNSLDNMFRFKCENLVDFDARTRGLQMWQIWGRDGICRSSEAAEKAEFGAFAYLPIPNAVSKLGYYVTGMTLTGIPSCCIHLGWLRIWRKGAFCIT